VHEPVGGKVAPCHRGGGSDWSSLQSAPVECAPARSMAAAPSLLCGTTTTEAMGWEQLLPLAGRRIDRRADRRVGHRAARHATRHAASRRRTRGPPTDRGTRTLPRRAGRRLRRAPPSPSGPSRPTHLFGRVSLGPGRTGALWLRMSILSGGLSKRTWR
jgi:hypothetical protein